MPGAEWAVAAAIKVIVDKSCGELYLLVQAQNAYRKVVSNKHVSIRSTFNVINKKEIDLLISNMYVILTTLWHLGHKLVITKKLPLKIVLKSTRNS